MPRRSSLRSILSRLRKAREAWDSTWPHIAHGMGWLAVMTFVGGEAAGKHPDPLLLSAGALLIAVQAVKRRE